jgi:hypothetical protein
MDDFQEQYRRSFEILGRPLGPEDCLPDEAIIAAEHRLGVQVPKALADFYRVAGRAEDFTCVFNRMLHPDEWTIEAGKLVFMEENQAVVLWATEADARPNDDPPAYQATTDEPMVWERVNDRCSVFLLVMTHWEAAFGASMPCGNTAEVEAGLVGKLETNWTFVGEVAGMKAFNKPGRVVCFLEEEDRRIFAGATSEAGLDAIASELGVRWE